jgi:hypothetical protein
MPSCDVIVNAISKKKKMEITTIGCGMIKEITGGAVEIILRFGGSCETSGISVPDVFFVVSENHKSIINTCDNAL